MTPILHSQPSVYILAVGDRTFMSADIDILQAISLDYLAAGWEPSEISEVPSITLLPSYRLSFFFVVKSVTLYSDHLESLCKMADGGGNGTVYSWDVVGLWIPCYASPVT